MDRGRLWVKKKKTLNLTYGCLKHASGKGEVDLFLQLESGRKNVQLKVRCVSVLGTSACYFNRFYRVTEPLSAAYTG